MSESTLWWRYVSSFTLLPSSNIVPDSAADVALRNKIRDEAQLIVDAEFPVVRNRRLSGTSRLSNSQNTVHAYNLIFRNKGTDASPVDTSDVDIRVFDDAKLDSIRTTLLNNIPELTEIVSHKQDDVAGINLVGSSLGEDLLKRQNVTSQKGRTYKNPVFEVNDAGASAKLEIAALPAGNISEASSSRSASKVLKDLGFPGAAKDPFTVLNYPVVFKFLQNINTYPAGLTFEIELFSEGPGSGFMTTVSIRFDGTKGNVFVVQRNPDAQTSGEEKVGEISVNSKDYALLMGSVLRVLPEPAPGSPHKAELDGGHWLNDGGGQSSSPEADMLFYEFTGVTADQQFTKPLTLSVKSTGFNGNSIKRTFRWVNEGSSATGTHSVQISDMRAMPYIPTVIDSEFNGTDQGANSHSEGNQIRPFIDGAAYGFISPL